MRKPTALPPTLFARRHEITADYLREVDRHLADIVAGRATEMFEIRDFAGILCIHATHLSNTIKEATGHSPCYFFEERILEIARQLLRDPRRSVADVAANLTYDPSNFTKFFKRFQGCTPKQYREQVWAAERAATAAKDAAAASDARQPVAPLATAYLPA